MIHPNPPRRMKQQHPPRVQPHRAQHVDTRLSRDGEDFAGDVTFANPVAGTEPRGGEAGVGEGSHRFFPLGGGNADLSCSMNSLTARVNNWVSFKPYSVAARVPRSFSRIASSILNATSVFFTVDFSFGISTTLTILHLNDNYSCTLSNRVIHYTSRLDNATIKTASGFNTRTESEQMPLPKDAFKFRCGWGPGFIYLMDSGPKQYRYKIGLSDNPTRRAASMNIALLAKIPVANMRRAEKAAHQIFSHRQRHFRDEYFALTSSDIASFKLLTWDALDQFFDTRWKKGRATISGGCYLLEERQHADAISGTVKRLKESKCVDDLIAAKKWLTIRVKGYLASESDYKSVRSAFDRAVSRISVSIKHRTETAQ
jgi:hypothetical protein